MLAISFSDNFIRYGQLIKTDNSISIELIGKKKLPFKFDTTSLKNPDLIPSIESLLLNIKKRLPVQERFLALSAPSQLFDITINSIDLGLEKQKIAEILDWNEKQRLGVVFNKKFVQHYPLKQRISENKRDYLTISYFKELGRTIYQACQRLGFIIKVFDLNIFSAANALESLYKEKNGKKWGLWLIGEKYHILLLIKSGEISQYLEFDLNNNGDYNILVDSSPNEDGENIVSQINKLRNSSSETIQDIENLYFFTYDVNSEFYNMLLTYDIDNLRCVDPFENFKPVKIYQDDGSGPGAMSQFLDVMGLLYRFML